MEGEGAAAAAEVSTLWVIIIALVVGAIVGWLAGLIVKGRGFGLIGNIVVGIIGAIIAGFLFPAIGVNTGGSFVWAIVGPLIGAVILLLVIGVFKRA